MRSSYFVRTIAALSSLCTVLSVVHADELPMDYVDTLPVAEESAAGRFIVLFKNKEMSAGGMEATMKKFGVRNTQLQFTSIKGFAGKLSDATVLALRNDPDVALVEPDRVVYAFSHKISSYPPFLF